jgi:hypothetical protein
MTTDIKLKGSQLNVSQKMYGEILAIVC